MSLGRRVASLSDAIVQGLLVSDHADVGKSFVRYPMVGALVARLWRIPESQRRLIRRTRLTLQFVQRFANGLRAEIGVLTSLAEIDSVVKLVGCNSSVSWGLPACSFEAQPAWWEVQTGNHAA